MKFLFNFNLPREVDKKVKEKRKNENGETEEVTRTVKETISIDFGIKKPTRSLNTSSELFYGQKIAEAIKAGLLTNAMLEKRFLNDDGIMSESHKKSYQAMYLRKAEAELELDEILKETEKTEEQKEKQDALVIEISNIANQLQNFELSQAGLFQNTADTYSRGQTITWWILNLSMYKDDKGNWHNFFGDENDYHKKLEVLDKMEEEDETFQNKVIRTFIYLISFWYVGRVSSEKEFLKAFHELDEAEKEGLFTFKDEEEQEEDKKPESGENDDTGSSTTPN